MRACVLLVGGLVACDPPPAPPPTASSSATSVAAASAPSTSAAPPPVDMPGLSLLGAGQAPVARRYALSAEPQTVIVQTRWGDALPAQEAKTKPRTRAEVKLACTPDGDGFRCSYEVVRAGLEDEDLAAMYAVPINAELAKLVGTRGSFSLSSLGHVRVHAPSPSSPPVEVELADRLARHVLPLPAAPLGVGGRWRRTATERVRGLEVRRTTTYTLMAVRGTTLSVTAISELHGGDTPTHLGGVPGHDLGGYAGRSTATLTVDVRAALPLACTDERTASFWTQRPGSAKQPWTRVTRTTLRAP